MKAKIQRTDGEKVAMSSLGEADWFRLDDDDDDVVCLITDEGRYVYLSSTTGEATLCDIADIEDDEVVPIQVTISY